MSSRKLFSSHEIINALIRGGFELGRKPKKNHQSLYRKKSGGGHDVTTVPLAEKEIPKGTFDKILELGNVDYEEFLVWAKIKQKGRKLKS